MTVKVYGTKICGACKSLKDRLTKAGVQFDDVDISQDSGARENVLNHGFMRVPVIEVDGQYEAGYENALVDKLLGLNA